MRIRRNWTYAASALLVLIIAVAGFVAIDRLRDPGPRPDPAGQARGPHRVAARFPRPAAGQPRWAVPDHHWTGLSEDWAGGGDPGTDPVLTSKLVSDGKRAIAYAGGVFTAYDGATGKRLWRARVPFDAGTAPVSGNGVVIVALPGGSGAPAGCVALDTATGAQRWRVPDCPPTAPVVGADEPIGVLLDGVFYYIAGESGTITGVDAATGERRYRRKVAPTGLRVLAVANGRLAAGMTYLPLGRSTTRTKVLLLTPGLRKRAVVDLTNASWEGIGFPLVSGDVLLARQRNVMRPVDARTGRRLRSPWPVPGGLQEHVVGVLGRTVVTSGPGTNGDRVSGYDLLTGARIWSREDRSALYTIADGTLFALRHSVVIIDPATGKTAFQGPGTRRIGYAGGHVVAAGGHIVVLNADGVTGYD